MSKRPFDSQPQNLNKRSKPDDPEQTRVLINKPISGIIIGKGGVRVQSIREQSGVGLTILSSDSQEADRVMSVKGSVEGRVKALTLIIQHILEFNASAQVERQVSADLLLLVHMSYAGAIIGKAGATIKQIMSQTGAAVRLSNEAVADSTDKVCTVAGTVEQIEAATGLILNTIAENPLRAGTQSIAYVPGEQQQQAQQQQQAMGMYGGGYAQAPVAYGAPPAQYGAPMMGGFGGLPTGAGQGMGGGPMPRSGVNVTEKIQIPSSSVGSIIGKGGFAIKDIKAQSGCTISIAVADPNEPEVRTITLSGSTQGIQAALLLIRQRAEAAPPASSNPYQPATSSPFGNYFPATPEDTTVEQLSIPAASAGLLIGKMGSVIKEMKAYSGAAISIADPSTENPAERVVTVRGSLLSVQYACMMIRQRLESTPASNPASQAGYGMGEQATEKLLIPSMCAGVVIGKGGSSINEIKQQSGCNVSIADPAPENPDERVVTITGSAMGLQTAIILIRQKVETYAPK